MNSGVPLWAMVIASARSPAFYQLAETASMYVCTTMPVKMRNRQISNMCWVLLPTVAQMKKKGLGSLIGSVAPLIAI